MSEILIEFAEPFMDDEGDLEDRKKMFSLASIAWNMSLLDEGERTAQFEKFLDESVRADEILGETRDVFRLMIESLVRRKLVLFPDVKRFIFDWELLENADGFHLNVASTVMENGKANESISPPKSAVRKSKIPFLSCT